MPTVIFDMHGVVYSFSPDLDSERSLAIFNEIVNRYPTLSDQEAESASIAKGLGGEPGELSVHEIAGALEEISLYSKEGYKVVFVSSSEADTTRAILEFLIRKKDIPLNVGSFEIHSVGDKADVAKWMEIFRKYDDITDIYEDNPNYLSAAAFAAKELGSKPKLHSGVTSRVDGWTYGSSRG